MFNDVILWRIRIIFILPQLSLQPGTILLEEGAVVAIHMTSSFERNFWIPFCFSKFLVCQNNFLKLFCARLSSDVSYLVPEKVQDIKTNIIIDNTNKKSAKQTENEKHCES